MATFRFKRKLYADIVGYTGSMPIYDNSPGVGKISSTTTANTADYQKQQLKLLKQREQQEHEMQMQQMKLSQERQEQQEKINQEQEKIDQQINKENKLSTTPDPKLLGLNPKPLPAISMSNK